jgi:hypothetical protein
MMMLIGLVVQLLAVVHFFNKLEHRITRLETHLVHLMRRSGMVVREVPISEENT